MALFNEGADVLAFHTGSTAVMAAAQERGKMAVAYHSDMRKGAPDAQIVAVTHHWGDHYPARVKAVQAGHRTPWQRRGGAKGSVGGRGRLGPPMSPRRPGRG